MSPLPYHVLSGFDKEEKIKYILSWSDFACNGHLSWEAFRQVISIIAPLVTDEGLAEFCKKAPDLPLEHCQHIIVRVRTNEVLH